MQENAIILIAPTLEAGERNVVSICMANTNRAQGMQVIMPKLQNFLHSFSSVTKHFTDFEIGKTPAQFIKSWDGEQVVVAIGRGTWASQCPKQREPTVDDVEGFGLVSEVMLSTLAPTASPLSALPDYLPPASPPASLPQLMSNNLFPTAKTAKYAKKTF